MYPAVDALVTLAADVKTIVGSSTLVTYGADWTEYGADVIDASEVRFPLDPLWASPAIGAVGIDYYAPLSDWRDAGNQLDTMLTDTPYRLTYLAGNLAAEKPSEVRGLDGWAVIEQDRVAVTVDDMPAVRAADERNRRRVEEWLA